MPKQQNTHKMYPNSAPFQGVQGTVFVPFQTLPFNTQQPPVKHPLNTCHSAGRVSVQGNHYTRQRQQWA